MFNRKQPVPTDIDLAIRDAHAFLAKADKKTDEYAETVDNLAKLYKMKETLGSPDRVSKDVVVTAAASLGSVVLILLFEGVGRGIITTKSLGFAPKPKSK